MNEKDHRLDDATTPLPRPGPAGGQAPPPARPPGDRPYGGAPSYGTPVQGGPPGAIPPRAPGGLPSYGGPGGPPPGSPGYGPPSHGAPPPGAPRSPHGPGARPTPGPVRPRVLWIVLAWIIAVVCSGIGVAGFAGGLFKTIDDAAPTQTFQSGGSVSAALDPAEKPVLYASASGPTDVTCLARDSAGQKASLTRPMAAQTVTAYGRTWELLFDIGVAKAGTYTITCRAEEGGQALFGVGRSLTASAGALAGGVASLILIPLAGFVLAVVTTIVVLVKRNRARRRPASPGYAGGWPQGPPPGA